MDNTGRLGNTYYFLVLGVFLIERRFLKQRSLHRILLETYGAWIWTSQAILAQAISPKTHSKVQRCGISKLGVSGNAAIAARLGWGFFDAKGRSVGEKFFVRRIASGLDIDVDHPWRGVMVVLVA